MESALESKISTVPCSPKLVSNCPLVSNLVKVAAKGLPNPLVSNRTTIDPSESS